MGFGVYVHVPFCSKRCDYCAFATWTDRAHLMTAYASACCLEIEAAVSAGMPVATSVFFGGGTPSLLPAPLLTGILARIPRCRGAEVTVECNPDTVTPALFDAYLAGGVTRVSFGVQSMVAHVLEGLGRTHDPASVSFAVETAVAAGFETWSADLIFGGFGERDSDWARTLSSVLALDPPHVSAYALTVEQGTPLASDPARHPDDDVQAVRYLMAEEALAGAGLANYEISNWARPGHECRHNLLYWEQGDYRGIGCAAHSHEGGRRWWNVRSPERYIALISAGTAGGGPGSATVGTPGSAEAGEEFLEGHGRRREALELGLRTRRGVPVGAIATDDVTMLGERGLIVVDDDRLVLTPEGRLLANEVAVRLVV